MYTKFSSSVGSTVYLPIVILRCAFSIVLYFCQKYTFSVKFNMSKSLFFGIACYFSNPSIPFTVFLCFGKISPINCDTSDTVGLLPKIRTSS